MNLEISKEQAMANLLVERMRLVVSKLKLLSSPDVDNITNIIHGLNLLGDYSVLLRGHLHCLKAELENNGKEK